MIPTRYFVVIASTPPATSQTIKLHWLNKDWNVVALENSTASVGVCCHWTYIFLLLLALLLCYFWEWFTCHILWKHNIKSNGHFLRSAKWWVCHWKKKKKRWRKDQYEKMAKVANLSRRRRKKILSSNVQFLTLLVIVVKRTVKKKKQKWFTVFSLVISSFFLLFILIPVIQSILPCIFTHWCMASAIQNAFMLSALFSFIYKHSRNCMKDQPLAAHK